MEKKLAETKNLLGLRKRLKAKKPDFIRQDAHKKGRVGKKYRKPKGHQSKMRLGFKGYRKTISKGYKSPRDVRHLSRAGLVKVVVHNAKDLEKIDPKNQGVVIAGAVGLRKKIELIKLCQQKSIQILSIRNPKEFLEKVEKRIKEKKEEKEAKQKIKEEKKKKEKKKEEKKPTIEETLTEEEVKEKEKKEKDKLLTQKGAE